MTRRIFSTLVLFTVIGAIVQVHAASDPAWKISFEKEIKWQTLTAAGNLVVSTDDALYGIDPKTGDITWQSEELKKLKQEFYEELPFTTYVLISASKGAFGTQTYTMVLDVLTGKEVWNSETLGLAGTMGQFLLDNGKLFVYGLETEKNKKAVAVADVETGKPIWTSQEFFKKDPPQFVLGGGRFVKKLSIIGNQEPVFDTDETMIVYMTKEGVQKFNAITGQLIWTSNANKKLKDPPALRAGYTQMVLSENRDVLYIPYDKKIYAISTKDGSPIWGKTENLEGVPNLIMPTPDGLLVRTGPNAKGKGKASYVVLDPVSGEPRWKAFKKFKDASGFTLKDGKVVLYNDKKLMAINLADGSTETIVDEIKFDGGESPGSVRTRPGGYFLSSSQNLALYDFDGNQKFHVYHKSMGRSMFAKIASTAAIASMNTMSAANAYSRAQSTGSDQKYSLITSNPILSERFKATANAENYVYILTEVEREGEKGPGLVKVNKNTGETESSIILGDKKPEYELDEIESRLFYKSDKKEITCYNF